MINKTALILLAILPACANGQYKDAIAREQAINDVWHQAKLRGVAFRAIGQEPAWMLEIIDGKDIMLVMDYGQSKVHFSYEEPIDNKLERKTLFALKNPVKAELWIYGKPCQDIMSGENFATTVQIHLSDKVLKGCGRALY